MQNLNDIPLFLEEEFPGCKPKIKKDEAVFVTVQSINTDQLLELQWLIKDGRTDINIKRSGTGLSIQFTQKQN